jgi:heme oxygenase
LLFVHASLEGRLRQLASANGVVRGIVDDEQFSESHLVEDLRHLGSDPRSHRPSDGTTELLSHLDHRAATCPVALLGSHYVLEGSKNGGRFIARAVRRAYGLSDAGTRYFDPYGDQQPERWRAFRASMDAAVFASDERAAIVETACETFAGITRIMQALWLSIAESSLAATTAG